MGSADLEFENPAIEVEGLVHRYRDRTALDGVSLQVGAGEIFGFLGPNGSGKSTLFRILSTLLTPTSGSARLFGRDVANDPDGVRAQIGVAFQSPSLDGKLTCLENLRHRGHLFGMFGNALSGRAESLLESFGLAGRRKEKVENLSGGLRRRLELAMALLHRPRMLLLDEPATGLDPGARLDLWEDLLALREAEGLTVALTTHLLEEGDRCDRLAILNQGRVVALGTPKELRSEIGGNVIDVIASSPAEFSSDLSEKLGVESRLVDGALRMEAPDAPALVTRLMGAFPDRIESIRVGKPTLGDVFLYRTGQAFREKEADS